MKIALLEPIGITDELLNELAQPIHALGHEFVSYSQKTIDPAELAARSQGCEVVMIANTPYPAQVVQAATELKMLDVAFTGIDHVAMEACKEKGIVVCNAANYSNQTVAELVIGMTISLLRNMTAGNECVRSGGTSAGLMGSEICGKTVGIIGTGHIGLITAKLFLAFGAQVVAYSRRVNPEAEALGIEYTTLPELMERCDVISLHTPNNAATRGMISREMVNRMKKTALFINCARGPIVDNAALAEALNEERIAGAGIDVFDSEPPISPNDPLLHAKNTVLMPHVGFLSQEAMIRRAHIVFDNVMAYLRGEPQNVCKN